MKRFDNIIQKSTEWFKAKQMISSGTFLKNIMGTPEARENAKYEYIANRLTVGVFDDTENDMARGNRLESEARVMFNFEKDKIVEETGYCVSEKNKHIGNSPDGLIGENEALEIKCPQPKNHVKCWRKNKVPKDYVWQVVQYFIVNEKLQKLYFVTYCPVIQRHPMHIIEITRENIGSVIEIAKPMTFAQVEASQEVFIAECESELAVLIKL